MKPVFPNYQDIGVNTYPQDLSFLSKFLYILFFFSLIFIDCFKGSYLYPNTKDIPTRNVAFLIHEGILVANNNSCWKYLMDSIKVIETVQQITISVIWECKICVTTEPFCHFNTVKFIHCLTASFITVLNVSTDKCLGWVKKRRTGQNNY